MDLRALNETVTGADLGLHVAAVRTERGAVDSGGGGESVLSGRPAPGSPVIAPRRRGECPVPEQQRLLLKVNQSLADVAKLVDARDLKSLDLGHTGSIPVVRTNKVTLYNIFNSLD